MSKITLIWPNAIKNNSVQGFTQRHYASQIDRGGVNLIDAIQRFKDDSFRHKYEENMISDYRMSIYKTEMNLKPFGNIH